MESIDLAISGMHCGGCVRHVTGVLERLPGVRVDAVQVGSARVSIDPARVQPEQVAAALTEAGHAARVEARPGTGIAKDGSDPR